MIEPTDEMVTAAAEALEEAAIPRIGRDLGTLHRDDIVRAALVAALPFAERQWQEQYGDAYQRGWWHGQHRLCPRCGVELEREVAEEERAKRAKDGPFGPAEDRERCAGCQDLADWHGPRGCEGDFGHCPCPGLVIAP